LEKLLSVIRSVKKTGCKFNPFDANFGFLENTHSDIIAKLLDPKLGLWDYFIRRLNADNKVDISYFSKNLKIVREKHKIDILLKDRRNAVIIENKIWAPDQPKQLARYYEKIKNQFDTVTIIYLTPFGHPPSKESVEDLQAIQISYQRHILPWLEEWYDENKNRSEVDENLRIFVKLYSEQIRTITNNNKYMIDILEKVFGTDDKGYAEEAISLYKSMSSRINLLCIGSIKDRIMETLRDVVSADYADGDVTEWYKDEYKECWVLDDESNDISFFISDADIYAERDKNELGSICCNNLDNKYLQDILTRNNEGIKQWLNSIYDN